MKCPSMSPDSDSYQTLMERATSCHLGTLQTRDHWSSLLRKSVPNYQLTGTEDSLRATVRGSCLL